MKLMKLHAIISLMLASTSFVTMPHTKHALGLIARRKTVLEAYRKQVQVLRVANAAARPPCTQQELVAIDLAIIETRLAGLVSMHTMNLLDLELYIGRIIAQDEKIHKKQGKQV